MRFAVVTLGSAGDLHPFLGIARELSGRGHEVVLLGQEPYRHQVEREGVQFRAIVSAADHERTLKHPLLWHPIDGFGVLWRHLCVPAIESCCQILGELAHHQDEPLVVFASPLAAGARFAQDRWPEQIRLISGYTAPMGLRDVSDPMFVGDWRVPSWTPQALRRGLWHALDHWKLEPMARPILQRWQRTWKTAAIDTSIFGDWLHSPRGGVALYPDWFAPIPAAWSARGVFQGGFPLFEATRPDPLPSRLLEFLAARSRPVVVYPGSAAGTSQRFMALTLEACEMVGAPAVILAPHLHSGLTEARAARDDCIVVGQVTLRLLLPRCSVFLHHGGIGSAAQGFAHRIPQIVLASAYDQYENGVRISALGAGRFFALNRVRTSQLHRALHATLECARAGLQKTVDPAGAAKVCDWLETKL